MKSKPLKSEKDRVLKDSAQLWRPLLRKVPNLEPPKPVKKTASPSSKKLISLSQSVTDSSKKQVFRIVPEQCRNNKTIKENDESSVESFKLPK